MRILLFFILLITGFSQAVHAMEETPKSKPYDNYIFDEPELWDRLKIDLKEKNLNEFIRKNWNPFFEGFAMQEILPIIAKYLSHLESELIK